MSDSEKPAGYFSTFSILDPNGNAYEGIAKTQKRNRRVFVCLYSTSLRSFTPSPCPHPFPPETCFSLLSRIRPSENLSDANFTNTRSHPRQCHRRKLRCDKRQPCSRCVQAGSPEDCTYQSLPSESKKTPSVEPSEDLCFSLSDSLSSSEIPPSVPIAIKPFHRANDGRARISGTTHWSTVASEVCMTDSR